MTDPTKCDETIDRAHIPLAGSKVHRGELHVAWCGKCKAEIHFIDGFWRVAGQAAEITRLQDELAGALATIEHLSEGMSWISGHDRQGLDHLEEAQVAVAEREAADARERALRAAVQAEADEIGRYAFSKPLADRLVAALAAGQPQPQRAVPMPADCPDGWFPFGTHAAQMGGPPLQFSGEDEAGMPLWETCIPRLAVEPQTEPQADCCDHSGSEYGHCWDCRDTGHAHPSDVPCSPVAAPVGVDPQEPPTTDDVPFPSCSTCGGDGLCRTCGGSGNDMAGVDLAAAGLTDGQAERIGREPGLGRDGQHNRPDGPTSAAASPVGVDLPAPTQDAPTEGRAKPWHDAEQVIAETFTATNRASWINVTGTAIATAALSALRDAGWGLMYPSDYPGVCGRCRRVVAPGTTHRPFNGNQMFACEIVDSRTAAPVVELCPSPPEEKAQR